ncbi:hypothetical protein CYMTET_23310 [Cymbomonas tetramitiformis]|uniref:Uncharacterized protein n=1 Tax=Cymbomonas tetramitiformis TaxID=36881 RepID=A0AAE0L128_9CHLO|nr:hypothetical protein CYMTET_23310 [Cymbomonas tetramitiformis]
MKPTHIWTNAAPSVPLLQCTHATPCPARATLGEHENTAQEGSEKLEAARSEWREGTEWEVAAAVREEAETARVACAERKEALEEAREVAEALENAEGNCRRRGARPSGATPGVETPLASVVCGSKRGPAGSPDAAPTCRGRWRPSIRRDTAMDEASVVQLAMRSYAVLSMREDFRLPLLNNGSVRLLGEFLRQPPGGPAARNRTAMLDAYASALVALYNVSLQPECQVGACRLAAPELYIALKWTAKMAQYPPKTKAQVEAVERARLFASSALELLNRNPSNRTEMYKLEMHQKTEMADSVLKKSRHPSPPPETGTHKPHAHRRQHSWDRNGIADDPTTPSGPSWCLTSTEDSVDSDDRMPRPPTPDKTNPPGAPASQDRPPGQLIYPAASASACNLLWQRQQGEPRTVQRRHSCALKPSAIWKEGSADLCHTVKSWEDTSLTVFKHVPGCQFCLSLYEHVTLPNGEVVHVYNKKHPQNKTEAVELLKPDVGLLAESGHGSLAAVLQDALPDPKAFLLHILQPTGGLIGLEAALNRADAPVTAPEEGFQTWEKLLKGMSGVNCHMLVELAERKVQAQVLTRQMSTIDNTEEWAITRSIFAPRQKESDGNDFYDTEDLMDLVMEKDWKRMMEKAKGKRWDCFTVCLAADLCKDASQYQSAWSVAGVGAEPLWLQFCEMPASA